MMVTTSASVSTGLMIPLVTCVLMGVSYLLRQLLLSTLTLHNATLWVKASLLIMIVHSYGVLSVTTE